jgi:hypothetical protein
MNRRRAFALGAAAACAALAAGCSDLPPQAALFPLEPGHSWTYRVTSEFEDRSRVQEQLGLRTLARATLAAREGLEAGPAWHRRSDSGADYWLRADASGIYRVASKSELDAEPRPDRARRYVLKAPYTVGTQWQAETAPYLLQRRADFPREVRHSHPSLPMLYSITAVDQAVEAAGRRYTGCLQVEGVGQLRLFTDPVGGWRNLPIRAREWYCPGVGLVRLEREELVGGATGFVYGGKLVMELVAHAPS